MTDGSRRAILAAFFANFGIACAKFAAWMATGAASMLAESVHSLADTGNQGLLILGSSRARRAPDAESNKLRGSASWWSFVRGSKKPELPVVLLEDIGALLGLVLALAGVLLAACLHDPRFDAAASAAIGVLLCGIPVLLSVEMKSLLIGESASPRDLLAIRQALATTPRVRRLIHLRTLHLGPDQLLVGAKLELDASLDFAGVARVINRAEDAVRTSVPTVRILYLEPDVHAPERTESGDAETTS